MKNTGKCPKCGGKDLIYVPGSVGAYGTGNNIMTGLTTLSAVLVNRYVCTKCGYTEEWVEDVPKLKKTYERP
ncbi:hypothetical protein ACTQ54_02365 [Fundicoccus sp. Sow4_H7]|uniref:hypothetical protein n=1 Tax=Fundicoccus sp. Sow4_H7 TaxID=3438784 RepID=UPI003F9376AF